MAFRLNILFSWFLGWVATVAFGLLSLVLLAGTSHYSATAHPAWIVTFFAAILIPPCFCYHAGLKSRRSLACLIALSILGWWVGSLFTPSVSMTHRSWMSMIVDLPLVGHEWTLSCMFFSAIASLCVIILAPNTKRGILKQVDSDPTT